MLDKLKDYMDELNLMEKQYGQEEELYPLINIMLRKWGNLEGCSIRTVADGKYAKDIPGRAYLGGYCAFPDIAILGEKFDATEKDSINYIYGCVEAKKLGEKLLEFDDGELKIEPERDILYLKPGIRAHYHYEFEVNNGQSVKDNDTIRQKYVELASEADLKNYVTIDNNSFDDYIPVITGEIKYPIRELKNIINDKSIYVKIFKMFKVQIGETELSPSPDDEAVMELIGELLCYGKVLYTNGIEWKEISISEIKGKYKEKNVNSVIGLRTAIKEKIKDDIIAENNLEQGEIDQKIQEILYEKITDKEINVLEEVAALKLKIHVKSETIANLFTYDEKNGVQMFSEKEDKDSKEEWRKLITYFVNMSWKPTESATDKNDLIKDNECTEATKSDVVK